VRGAARSAVGRAATVQLTQRCAALLVKERRGRAEQIVALDAEDVRSLAVAARGDNTRSLSLSSFVEQRLDGTTVAKADGAAPAANSACRDAYVSATSMMRMYVCQ
jgi:hypothetical protein